MANNNGSGVKNKIRRKHFASDEPLVQLKKILEAESASKYLATQVNLSTNQPVLKSIYINNDFSTKAYNS